MIDIGDIKIKALNNSYNKLTEAILENNKSESYVEFFNFLYNLFALREGIGKKDVDEITRLKKDSVFGAMKYLYEIYKHTNNNDANKLIKASIFVSSKKYPYSYPYTYGEAFIKYANLPQELINTQNKQKHKDRFKFLYEKYLNEQFLLDVVEEAKKETLKLIGEKNEKN